MRENDEVAAILAAAEHFLKAFPPGTVHNWANGPHIKTPSGDWVPLKGKQLRRWLREHPKEGTGRTRKQQIKESLKRRAKEQLEDKDKPRLGRKGRKMARAIPKEDFLKVLDLGHFSIISAGRNPVREGGEAQDSEFFAEREKALKEDLEELGVPYLELLGKYGGTERSFIVLHDESLDPSDKRNKDLEKNTSPSFMVGHGTTKKSQQEIIKKLDRLARKYNQDSVIHVPTADRAFVRWTAKQRSGKSDCYAKKEKGRVWRDETDATDYFSWVPHPKKQYTKFSFNLAHCWS